MNKNFLNLRKSLLSGALALSVMLTGCSGEKDSYRRFETDTSNVLYESDNISGRISHEDVDNFGVIITFSLDTKVYKCIALKTIEETNYMDGRKRTEIKYTDLRTGATIYCKVTDIKNENQNTFFRNGENKTILEEESIAPYLYENDYLAYDYDINEFITFCEENIDLSLEDNSKMSLD